MFPSGVRKAVTSLSALGEVLVVRSSGGSVELVGQGLVMGMMGVVGEGGGGVGARGGRGRGGV